VSVPAGRACSSGIESEARRRDAPARRSGSLPVAGQTALSPSLANSASSRATSGLPVVSSFSP
jgi:hypothetical protein